MARLILDRVTRRFGGFTALDTVSLDVSDGEMLAVLGPSGCGKTTLLRAIAGFDSVDGGRITIDERMVSGNNRHMPPEQRRVGIVFQSYALWPHMSVGENIGYPLRVARVPGPERHARIEEMLALVGLSGFGDRRPGELSGGQRQRVALARCLIMTPSLVLLDEPLANLDVHLRASMEAELALLHRRTRTTMVYITHDQGEAMALADRIAVMDQGRLLQVASPQMLYREPANETVARFVGEGMVLPVTVLGPAGTIGTSVDLAGIRLAVRSGHPPVAGSAAKVCLRPRGITVAKDNDDALFPARVVRALYRGGSFRLEARLDAFPGELLRFDVPEPCQFVAGDVIKLSILDSWLLP